MKDQSSDRLYLTPEEAASKLGVKKRTLDKWRIDSVGPKWIAIGEKQHGYFETDIIDWLNDHKVDPAKEAGGVEG